jgi:sugar phosphate isomerase/epimerase
MTHTTTTTQTAKEARIEEIKKEIAALIYKETEIDADFITNEDFSDFDELKDLLEDNNSFDVEIIYYSNAMEYLRNNDPSLKNSLKLAENMGFELKSLNSETLASLLASDNARDSFYELEAKISDLIIQMQAIEEEEEEEEEEDIEEDESDEETPVS